MRYQFLCVILLLFFSNLNPYFGQVDSLKKVAIDLPSSIDKAAVLEAISKEYLNVNHDSALYYCNKSNTEYYAHGTTSDKAFMHTYLGVIFKKKTFYDSAIANYHKAIYYHQIDTFSRGVAANYVNLGNTYTLKGDNDIALKYLFDAVLIFENEHDTLNLAITHANIGEVLLELGELEQAKAHFNISKTQYAYQNSLSGEGWVNYDLGILAIKEQQVDTALHYLTLSKNQWKSINRNIEYINCFLRIGEAYELDNNDKLAKENYLEAVKLYSEIEYKIGLSEAFLLLGELAYKQEAYKIAIPYFTNALKLSNHIKSNQITIDVYQNLYNAHLKLNNTAAALSSLEKYTFLKDSLEISIKNEAIAEYQTKLNVITKEKMIASLEDSTKIVQLQNQNLTLENQKQNLQNGQQKIGLYLLTLGVLIALVFLYILFRQIKSKTKLNIELKAAIKEREILIREVHHRVKNNLQIVSSLLSLQKKNINEKNAEEVLKMSQSRIETMSIIHEKLYQSDKLSDISFKEYIENLTGYLTESFSLGSRGIQIITDIPSVSVHIDQLVPCGLILNELVTNCIKHAFINDAAKNEIKISCASSDNGCTLSVTDNGAGLPEDFNLRTSKSLGFRLVNGLTKQLKGTVSVLETNEGAHFKIVFPIKK